MPIDPQRLRDLADDIRAALNWPPECEQLCRDAADELERLRGIIIHGGLWQRAPCCVCGYNGPGYYQPDTHRCAELAAKGGA